MRLTSWHLLFHPPNRFLIAKLDKLFLEMSTGCSSFATMTPNIWMGVLKNTF